MAHHGSLSRERRLFIEDQLKRGELKGLVATSSLELGIDMGAVDLVIQVESPGAVSRGLQRIGRAGHQVGEPSKGKLFPKHRNDLVEAAVVVDRMKQGLIEHTRYPRNPLDVLAQQIVAMVAMEDWSVDDLATLIRSSANYSELSDEVLANVLDLLAGRYPSEEFGELRPRVVWDRIDGMVRARAGAQRLAVTSGGTIVDRGLFGVFLPDGTRVGELDEEMVYESRPGETFLLGASTWRIEDITHERVVVTPAPGQPGKMPFWKGDGPGRPLELGRALGEFVRTVRATPRAEALAELQDRNELDPLAADNLLAYLDEQAEACGGVVPDDRTIVVERFRDEIGDWRVCVHTPFGAQVHAPWAMALQARLAERWGVEVDLIWSDDGIVMRLPDAIDAFPVEELSIDPAEIDELVIAQLPNSAMFAGRFRECAARALLLPRRRPDRRTPLWQQRQRAADLLAVASRYPDFPILLETTRECLNDVFDLPALREVLTDLRARRVRMVPVDTPRASPFAQSLLFGWIAVYMYEGDAPMAERRAAALALDRELLRELLGAEELRELVDPAVLADLELELQRLTDGRRARDADEVHDLFRLLGPLSRWEVEARTDTPDPQSASTTVGTWLDTLVRERRAIAVSVAGEERFAAAEDAARLRDALGVALPPGLPAVFTDPVPDPLVDLVARFARTHGPFVTGQVATRYGVGVDRVAARARAARDRRPGGPWASSDPTASSGSGATTTCCASCGAGPSPPSGARSSPSRATRSPASSPPGRTSGPPAAVSTRWSRPSARSRGWRCPPRCSSPTSSPAGSPTTGPPISTPSAPPASWCGWAPAPSAPATGASACSSANRPGCWSPHPPPTRWPRCSPTRSPPRSTDTSANGARRSGPTSSPRPRARGRPTTTRPCSTPCGPSCGRGWSPTTRWRRCGRWSRPAAAARSRPAGRALGPAVGRARSAGAPISVVPPSGRSTASAHPPRRVAGRWWRPCSSPDPRPPRRPTPPPCSCSSATACSPGKPSWPRASREASPRSTPCSRRWRSAVRSGAATS